MAAPIDDSPPPFRIEHHRCKCDAAPRVPLFTWIGEPEGDEPTSQETTFTVPEYVEAHVGLDYLEVLHTQGDDAANRWVLLRLLGAEGWRAVRSPGIDAETFQGILSACLRTVFGSLQTGPKGRLHSVP